jgi:uncharacterized protein
MPAEFQSAIYACEVVHERLKPRRHGFRYELFFMDLWLDELPRLDAGLRLFSLHGLNAFSFYDEDHLDLGAGNTRLNLARWLRQEHGVEITEGMRVRLITLPRMLGYLFNPVCFYFIYDADGRALHAVCEVTNTFHEMKPYYLGMPVREGYFERVLPKQFYVSPFSKLDTSFHFQLEVPAERIRIHIDDLEAGERTLVSWIHGEKQAMSDLLLARSLLRYPAMTLLVIARIHWQALLLWWRKFEFFRKRARPDLQTGVYRPHASLTDPSKSP